jgi:hypothetical protein
MISDAASLSVMLEMIGHQTPRWVQQKRQQFILLEASQRNINSSSSGSSTANQPQRTIPRCLTHQESRSQRGFSSVSSSSVDLSNEANSPEAEITLTVPAEGTLIGPAKGYTDEKSFNDGDQGLVVHSQEDRSVTSTDPNVDDHDASKDFHDYNAMPLPDPKMSYNPLRSSGSSLSEDSPVEGKEVSKRNHSSDALSSGDDSAPSKKRHKMATGVSSQPPSAALTKLPTNVAKKGGISHNVFSKNHGTADVPVDLTDQAVTNSSRVEQGIVGDYNMPAFSEALFSNKLPPNIAKRGGISHSIRPSGNLGNGEARLEVAPAISLPPFRGLGRKSSAMPVATKKLLSETSSFAPLSETSDFKCILGNKTISSESSTMAPLSVKSYMYDVKGGVSVRSVNSSEVKTPSLLTTDVEESTSSEDGDGCVIRGGYYINQDSQALMGDVLMCPFVFRSHDAVTCGSLAECIMPGMLRAHFSARNKLISIELTYDAMGFMQQLSRASGNDSTAQIIPSSVEMALTPNVNEARVITLAKAPYRIMNVNEQWTRLTGYTQMDAEGNEYLALLEGEATISATKKRNGMPLHLFEEVAKGRPACSTNIHYSKDGSDFVEFVCSFPLTNDSDEVTHLLHISKELPTVTRENDY